MNNISDEQISAYFLGKTPTEEVEAFEMQTSSNAELGDLTQALERELIDDYVRGNLSAEDARLFERNYLTTEIRRSRLSAAQALWQVVAEESISSPAPEKNIWQTIFGKKSALRLAFACAALLVCGVFAFYLLSLGVKQSDVAEVKEPHQSVKNEVPPVQNEEASVSHTADYQNSNPAPPNSADQNSETARPLNAPPKKQAEINQPKRVEPNKPALAMVFKLMPGSMRAEENEQAIKIEPSAKKINLLLSPAGEPNNYKIYRAVLKSPETGTVFTSSNLKSLSVTVPVEKLENRTYMIFLEGQNAAGDFETITEYTFRVRR